MSDSGFLKELQQNGMMAASTSREVEKGSLLKRGGEIANEFYMVESGCLRSFVVDKKGKEHILQFAPEGWVISDRASFLSGEASDLFIDSIESSVIRVLRYDNMRNMEDMSREQLLNSLKRIFRHTLTLQNRILQLISMSAQERYTDFMKTYPDLHNRVPQRMIASYLGITPEGLSRIRKEK